MLMVCLCEYEIFHLLQSKMWNGESVSNVVLSSYGVVIFLSCSSSHSFVAFPSPPL